MAKSNISNTMVLIHNKIVYTFVLAVFFSACSFKKHFATQESKAYDSFTKSILSSSKAGIIFNDKSIFVPKTNFTSKVKGNFLVIADQNHIVSSSEDYKACVINKSLHQERCYQLPHKLISASIQNNILAGLLENNTFIIYDLQAAKLQFYKKQNLIKAFSTSIASPVFYKHVVIFPSLDGQLVFFDFKKKLFDKTIFLESNSHFSNINFLKVINENLIAANKYQVLVIKDDELFEYKASIKAITNDNESLFIALNNGSLVKLNFKLEELQKVSFKEAQPIALSIDKQLVLLDARGYILRLSKNLKLIKTLRLYDDIKDHYYLTKQRLFYKQRLLYF